MKLQNSNSVKMFTDKSTPYPPTNIAFWRAYWITLRPYLFFISGSAGLLGLALTPDAEWATLLIAFVAFFFSYGLGQAVTDTFQVDTDSISAPYRPLVNNEISKFHVLVISLTGLGVCALVFAFLNPWTLLLCALGVAGLITYTWFKRRWWAGPFWNAWIVALLPAIGFLSTGNSPSAALSSPIIAASMLVTFFSYAIFVLLGYFKDISADRQTGYNTLPVAAGWDFSIWISATIALLAFCTSLWLLSLIELPIGSKLMTFAAYGGVLFWLAGVALFFRAHYLMYRIRYKENEAFKSIGLTVKGFILIHLGLSVVICPELFLFATFNYALFEWTLHCRPDEKQI